MLGTITKVINARICLKIDTEDNWTRTDQFIPMPGEPIIYSGDEYHSYPRVKVGDGVNLPRDLPFMSSGVIESGDFVVVRESRSTFPPVGDRKCMYVDLSDNSLYIWMPESSYIPVGKTKVSVTKQNIKTVNTFDPGSPSTMYVDSGVGYFEVGQSPVLTTETVSVVTDVEI